MLSEVKLKSNTMPQTLEKKRQYYLDKSEWSHCDETTLPIRLTSCTFQRPVTRITSHPGNVVRHRQCEGTLEKPPASLCVQETAGSSGLQPSRRSFQDHGQRKCFQDLCPAWCEWIPGPCWCLVSHTSPEPILAQSSDGAEMNPGLGLFLPHTLCRQPVTDGGIHQQSRKVKRARKRLAMAWMADRLAREAERARSPEN